jgi:hypothetical protein
LDNNGQTSILARDGYDVNDALDGARSAASECQRVVALKQTTLRGAVQTLAETQRATAKFKIY